MEKKSSGFSGLYKYRYEGMILLQNLVYATIDPLIKVAYRTVPVYTFMTGRYIVTFLFFFLVFHKQVLPELKKAPVWPYLVPSFCTAASFITFNVALDISAATTTAFLRSLSVTFVPLLLLIFCHERFSWKDAVVQGGTLVGLYLLCVGQGWESSLGGDILALSAALFAATAVITTPWALRHVSVPTLSFMNGACSLLLSAGAGIVSGVFRETDWTLALQPQNIVIVLLASLVASCGGYLLQNTAMTHISPKTTSILQCCYPVITSIVAFFLLQETLSLKGLIGAGVLTACMLLESLHKA